jgi:hypothetical protein
VRVKREILRPFRITSRGQADHRVGRRVAERAESPTTATVTAPKNRKAGKLVRLIRWTLRSDKRTARAYVLLAPVCQAVVVIAVCGTTLAIVTAVLIAWVLGGPLAGIGALGICAAIGGTVAWRYLRGGAEE